MEFANPKIHTQVLVIGREVGGWHICHSRLVNDIFPLDEASDKFGLEVTQHFYEALFAPDS